MKENSQPPPRLRLHDPGEMVEDGTGRADAGIVIERQRMDMRLVSQRELRLKRIAQLMEFEDDRRNKRKRLFCRSSL